MGLDRNGYAPSILDTEQGVCFACGNYGDTARHEIYYGTGNRTVSKMTGLWVNLCPRCHRIVHEKADNGVLDGALKRSGYRVFCIDNDPEAFRALIGRYYDE